MPLSTLTSTARQRSPTSMTLITCLEAPPHVCNADTNDAHSPAPSSLPSHIISASVEIKYLDAGNRAHGKQQPKATQRHSQNGVASHQACTQNVGATQTRHKNQFLSVPNRPRIINARAVSQASTPTHPRETQTYRLSQRQSPAQDELFTSPTQIQHKAKPSPCSIPRTTKTPRSRVHSRNNSYPKFFLCRNTVPQVQTF